MDINKLKTLAVQCLGLVKGVLMVSLDVRNYGRNDEVHVWTVIDGDERSETGSVDARTIAEEIASREAEVCFLLDVLKKDVMRSSDDITQVPHIVLLRFHLYRRRGTEKPLGELIYSRQESMATASR